MSRGFFGIGIFHPKNVLNIGTLWRSAHAFGADFIFTIGRRYRRQASDTTDASKHIPLFEHASFDEFFAALPKGAQLIGVECNTKRPTCPLPRFIHPERAVYLLGAEDYGLPPAVIAKCRTIVEISTARCINVAVAGSIILYDRIAKIANAA